MKTIGLLGGMSWESTSEYYRVINESVKQRLGGLHSADIVLQSIDFGPVETFLRSGHWDAIASILINKAKGLELAGADFMLMCTNTMHKLAPVIAENVSLPLLHIADATAEALIADKIEMVGLLGTAFTMEEGFYRKRLIEKHGISVVIPNESDRKLINRVIFAELCQGKIDAGARLEYLRIMNSLGDQGAEALVLGCTEIGLLVKQQDIDITLYDTTSIHAEKAVAMALQE